MEDVTLVAHREMLKRLLIERFTNLDKRIRALEDALESMRGDGR